MARCLRDCYDSNTGGFFQRGIEYPGVKAGHPLSRFFDLPREESPPQAKPQEPEAPTVIDLT